MSVELRQFIEADIDGYNGQSPFISEGRDEQKTLREIVEADRKIHLGFESVIVLEKRLKNAGYLVRPEDNDARYRKYIEEIGAYPEYAAVLFLNVFSFQFPELFLGALMISYNSELELGMSDPLGEDGEEESDGDVA